MFVFRFMWLVGIVFSSMASAQTIYLQGDYIGIGNNGIYWTYDESNVSENDVLRKMQYSCPTCVFSTGHYGCCSTALSYRYRTGNGQWAKDFGTACEAGERFAQEAAIDACQSVNGIACYTTGTVCREFSP